MVSLWCRWFVAHRLKGSSRSLAVTRWPVVAHQPDLASAAPGKGLDRQWARGRIDAVMDSARLAGTEPDEAAIVELSLSHGVMSPFTSFVAIEERVSRPEGVLNQEACPPCCRQAASPMLRYPQTATFGPLLTALGLVGLMFCWLVMLSRRQSL